MSRRPSGHDTAVDLPPVRAAGRAEPYVLVLSGSQFGELVELEPGREMVIGRRADAEIFLGDDGVSRRHASITPRNGEAVLRDLGSQNGTFVLGQRISETRVRSGQRFQLGTRSTLKFVWSDDPEARVQRDLAQGARVEPLTGLANRRHLLERFGIELAASQRHGRPLALLLADVDHFRQVNDQHGLDAGDEALRMVARVLQGAVRREDLVARFGGEEFVVLARETGLPGARVLAERVRRAVERSRCRHEGHELAVTLSIGVAISSATLPLDRGRTQSQMLEAADRALTRAKQNGRNAVVAATAPGP